MRHRSAVTLTLSMVALLAGCVRGAPSTETFNWKGPARADSWLRLRNTNGDFDVKEGTGDSVQITLEITRSNNYAPSATVKVLETADGLIACVLFGDATTCSASEYKGGSANKGGPLPFMRGRTSVSGTITLPRGVKLDVASVNGDVTVGAIERDLKVETVNGDVTVKGSKGPIDLHTTNGEIVAELGALGGAVKAGTTNGDVTLTMPTALNAVLNMRTVNGDLDLALAGNVTTRTKKSIVATLGTGGTSIDIETTNGDITVKPVGAPE